MTSCCRGLNNLLVVHRDDKLLQRVEQPAGGS